jgi:putative SOS response-associated peptidase YedK
VQPRKCPRVPFRKTEVRWNLFSDLPEFKPSHNIAPSQSLLKPFPAELMAPHEVSKQMNNPKYDAPDCSAPVEG